MTIEYEYQVSDIIRQRNVPFKNKNEEENIIIWIYDNNNMEYDIERVSLQVNFNRSFSNTTNILAYPEKFLTVSIKFNSLEKTIG